MTKLPNSTTDLPKIDQRYLDDQWSRCKTRVFLGKNAHFLGPIMSDLTHYWSTDIPTGATNGIGLWINPYFFLVNKPACREFLLTHELWHPGLLHNIRRGNRDPEVWNWAADIRINNWCDREGMDTKGVIHTDGTPFKMWLDHSYDQGGGGDATTEEIYEDLIVKHPPGTFFNNWNDIIDIPAGTVGDAQAANIINRIVKAFSSAKHSSWGNGPGEVESTVTRFLRPKLPWAIILNRFFNEIAGHDYTMRIPNRRYMPLDKYMSSIEEDSDGLQHLLYVEDVSGSISESDHIRFMSEFKYIKDTYRPKKMTMIQFDTIIQKVDVWTDDDEFNEIMIKGGGGTSLAPVRDWIIEHKPTAAVVFSDLYCEPMELLPPESMIPICWIALNNRGAKVNMGEITHLNE
jgi:predicted metal-dependent peptidase